jgi:hypothetical protein
VQRRHGGDPVGSPIGTVAPSIQLSGQRRCKGRPPGGQASCGDHVEGRVVAGGRRRRKNRPGRVELDLPGLKVERERSEGLFRKIENSRP